LLVTALPPAARKTSTLTFRIDQTVEKALREEAEEQKVSLNTLANQVFSGYCHWDRFMRRFGVVVMSRDAFRAILDSMPTSVIESVASQIGSRLPKEFILLRSKKIDARNVIEFIQMYFEHCGYGKFHYKAEGRNHIFSVRHNLGPNGSTFLRAFLGALLNETVAASTRFQATENVLSFSFSTQS